MTMNEFTKEYKNMFRKHTQEENALAEKYAKFKIGKSFLIKDKKFTITECFPEEQNDGTPEVRYILVCDDKEEKDVWMLERDLEKEKMLFTKYSLVEFLNIKKEFDEKISKQKQHFREQYQQYFDYIENQFFNNVDYVDYEEYISDFNISTPDCIFFYTKIDNTEGYLLKINQDGEIKNK